MSARKDPVGMSVFSVHSVQVDVSRNGISLRKKL